MADTLKGTVKFKYQDNRFQAQKYFKKDINALCSRVDALNARGVSYNYEEEILNEPDDDMGGGRYYGHVHLEIVGSELGPAEMKEAIEEGLSDIDNLDSVFIYD